MKAKKTRKALQIMIMATDMPIPDFEAKNVDAELEELERLASKQTPMEAYYEYDDEFTCPACNYFEDGINVPSLKFCPDCGQKLKW